MIVIWAEVDPTYPQVEVTFRIYGTGDYYHQSHKDETYINTVQMSDGYVWHVYEVE